MVLMSSAIAASSRLLTSYWHKDVVQTALNKSLRLQALWREWKGFLQVSNGVICADVNCLATTNRHSARWRSAGFDTALSGRDSKTEAYDKTFRAIRTRLLADPFTSIDDLAPTPSQTNGNVSANGTSPRNSLTPSGLGVVLDKEGSSNNLHELSRAIRGNQYLRVHNLQGSYP